MRRTIARTPALDLHPKMDSIKLQLRPNALRSTNISSRISSSNWKQTRRNLSIFVIITVILALFCYLFVIPRGSHNSVSLKRKFGIIIDGGSTGTRIHVFEFSIDERGKPVFDFGKEGMASMKVNPGLSSFSGDPESAGRSLLELLEFGKGRITKDYWVETEIRLMATAGLRRLSMRVQNRILESCRVVLRSSGFKFRDDWASVITGSDEGIFAWAAANYALGTLGGDPQQTTGIIELGGASAQVTFVSSELLPPAFARTLKFGKFTYNLYSHSLLDFGQNVAYDSLQDLLISRHLKSSSESIRDELNVDPCTPKGYSPSLPTLHSGGNFTECRHAALTLLHKGTEKCSYQQCRIGSTFIPELQGKFLATENFFYTSKFFGLTPTAFLSDLMSAGQQFCEEDWSKLKMKYHSLDDEDLLRYCFSSAYIVALLHDSLGIALDDKRIGFANQVGDIPLDWALGAFILQSTTDLDREQPDWIVYIFGYNSSTLLSLCGVSAILIFTAWSVAKWRRPQLKTIYDLEKGRYIVTRVNR